jgi:processing peptidase subunit beta
VPYTSSKNIELLLLKELIGTWTSTDGVGPNGWTKMAQVMGENNYTNYFSAFNLSFKDTGFVGVQNTATDNNLEQSMWWTMDSLVSLCHKLEDEDVEVAKANVKAAYLKARSSTADSADSLANDMLMLGKTVSTAEFFTRVDAVSAADCMAVAQEVIRDQDHALAAVGPLTELPDYTWIRRRSYWLRY